MTGSSPSLTEWRRLYEAAARVKETAPWEWMTETDLFGVRNPETGELGFVSIMGALGEHLAVALYLGPESLQGFWHIHQEADPDCSETVLVLSHLQASFEDREELAKPDRDVIKKLALRFRGRQAWPLFRSYRPGYWPWYVEPSEARFLTCALEQVVGVALRFREDPALLEPPGDDSYLVRVSSKREGDLVWADRVEVLPPMEPQAIPVQMDLGEIGKAKRLPQGQRTFEVDFFMFPARIGERGVGPYYPYALLVVDRDRGMVCGSELLAPEPSLRAMRGTVPGALLDQFVKTGVVPRRIRVRSTSLVRLLQPLIDELGLDLKPSRNLRCLDEAKDSLLHHFA